MKPIFVRVSEETFQLVVDEARRPANLVVITGGFADNLSSKAILRYHDSLHVYDVVSEKYDLDAKPFPEVIKFLLPAEKHVGAPRAMKAGFNSISTCDMYLQMKTALAIQLHGTKWPDNVTYLEPRFVKHLEDHLEKSVHEAGRNFIIMWHKYERRISEAICAAIAANRDDIRKTLEEDF